MVDTSKPKIVSAAGLAKGKSSAIGVSLSFWRGSPDDKIYGLVGYVASEWSHLEHELDTLIWELSGMSRAQGACVTGQMIGHVPRLFAIIGLLALQRVDRKLIDEAHSLMDMLRDANEERNRMVHDPWYMEVTQNKPYQQKGVSRKDLQKRKATKPFQIVLGIHDTDGIARAEQLRRDILKHADRVRLFARRVRDVLDASRGK